MLWTHWGPALHLLGSQTIVCVTSCPFSSVVVPAAGWGDGTVNHPQWAGWLWSLCPGAASLDLLPSTEPAVRERCSRRTKQRLCPPFWFLASCSQASCSLQALIFLTFDLSPLSPPTGDRSSSRQTLTATTELCERITPGPRIIVTWKLKCLCPSTLSKANR